MTALLRQIPGKGRPFLFEVVFQSITDIKHIIVIQVLVDAKMQPVSAHIFSRGELTMFVIEKLERFMLSG